MSLPSGWSEQTIADVAEVIRGVTYSKIDTITAKDEDAVPLLRATNLEPGKIDYEDMVYIPKSGVKPQQFLQVNDIFLAASSGSISVVGKSAQVKKVNGETFGAFCAVIRPLKISSKYLGLWVQTPFVRELWSSAAKGTNINNLKPSDLSQTKIPVPPLPEQERIVEILEDHLSRLDAALADVKRARELIDSLNRSALERYFPSDQKHSSKESRPLHELCQIGDGNHSSKYPTKKDLVEIGVPFIRAQNLVSGKVECSDLQHITEAKHATLKKGHLRAGDLLITNRGQIGKMGILPQELDGSNLNSQIAWLRCSEFVSNKYLYYFLLSPNAKRQMLKETTGTALQQLTIKNLRELSIPFASLEEQDEKVLQLDSVFMRTNSQRNGVSRMDTMFSALRRSLLQAAFTGELTKEEVNV
jgi:type I restriction enzyme S subunit